LKWVGGKGRLLAQYEQYFPKKFNNYFEPFVGGGAIFFYLFNQGKISKAFLNDSNEELINCYKAIKDNVQELIEELKSHRNEKQHYYAIRDLDRNDNFHSFPDYKRAARTIYLNRTCFNGLYRVNSKGKFNVPQGRYNNPTICDENNLLAVSNALKTVDFFVGDFEAAVADAKKGDFVYFDPPYIPLSKTSNFTSYTKDGFNFEDQKRLAGVFRKLARKGVSVMLSNSGADGIVKLYDGFTLYKIMASRAINCKAEGRGKILEYLIIANC